MFLNCKHEYGEDKSVAATFSLTSADGWTRCLLRREKHLNEQSLCLVRSSTERSRDGQGTGKQGLDNACRGHSSKHLCNEDKKTAQERHCPNQAESQCHLYTISHFVFLVSNTTHSWVEKST